MKALPTNTSKGSRAARGTREGIAPAIMPLSNRAPKKLEHAACQIGRQRISSWALCVIQISHVIQIDLFESWAILDKLEDRVVSGLCCIQVDNGKSCAMLGK